MAFIFNLGSRRVYSARALSMVRWIQDDQKENSHWLIVFFSAIISEIDPFKYIDISKRIDFITFIIIYQRSTHVCSGQSPIEVLQRQKAALPLVLFR